jgi:peptidoglycan/LPS O-acetylase OafA/YrhL
MNKSYSLYLDTVRFLAALFVVFEHFMQSSVVSKEIGRFIPDLGREAVMVFFVLSGYVIAYTVTEKRQTLKDYALARCARIYSVALPIMLAAFAVAYINGVYFSNSLAPSYQVAKAYFYIPFHSLFLGELWNLSETPPGLTPYWSLGFEVWYYVFFATIFYFSGYKRILLAIFVFLILGHKLWLLLPVWLSGVVLFYKQDTLPLNVKQARLIWILSIAALCGFKYWSFDLYLREMGESLWPFESLNLGSASRYLADYVVCFIVLANFYSARYAHFFALDRFSVLIRSVSSYTFTLYLLHMLVISMCLRFTDHDNTSATDILGISILIAVFTYLVGVVTERRKPWFASAFKNLFEYAENISHVLQRKRK